MKLILENFRCYSNKIFTIPNKGLILLSGKSGKGKTTLLQSIIYAFYGECSVNPNLHGTKSCSVTLEYQDIKIQRKFKGTPHKLVVNYNDQEYIDDVGQEVINKFLGLNYDEFITTSYVEQRSQSSVITMTPSEQMKFVEKLAFTDDTRTTYQQKFKSKVKECQKNISYMEGKISSLKEHHSSESKRLPSSLPSSENIPSVEELKSSLKKTKKEISSNESQMKKIQEKISSSRKEEERKKTILEQKKILEVEINQYVLKKEELGTILTEDEIDEKNKELISLTEKVENMKKYITYTQCLERAHKIKNEYIENIKKELKSIKVIPDKKLEELQSRNEELLEQEKIYEEERSKIEKDNFFREQSESIFQRNIAEIKETFSTLKTTKTHLIVNFLNKKNVSIKKEIVKLETTFEKLNTQKICGDVYECPNCNTSLYFSEGTLNIAENTTSPIENIQEKIDEIRLELEKNKTIQSKIEVWLKCIKDISDLLSKKPLEHTTNFNKDELLKIRDEISQIQHKKEKYQKIQSEIEILEKDDWGKYPSSIKTLFLEVEEAKKFFPKKFKPVQDIETLQDKIEEHKIKIIEERRKRNDYVSLEKDISVRQSKLKTIENSLSNNFLKSENSSNLEEEFNTLRENSIANSEKMSSIQSLLSVAIDKENYEKDVKRLEDFQREIEKSENKLSTYQRQLEGSLGLLNSDKEAQILSLKTTISKINSYSKYYLDKLFDEDDEEISVTLESHKLSTKGDKVTKINTNILYKGQKYNSFRDFCGGESQKCELAFLFGVNDMLGSNIVLLDECINNLDNENNMKVLYSLKKICGDKLTIVIAHEAILGVFDEIIQF